MEVVRWLRQEKETARQEVHLVQQEAARLRQDCLRYQRDATTSAAEVQLVPASASLRLLHLDPSRFPLLPRHGSSSIQHLRLQPLAGVTSLPLLPRYSFFLDNWRGVQHCHLTAMPQSWLRYQLDATTSAAEVGPMSHHSQTPLPRDLCAPNGLPPPLLPRYVPVIIPNPILKPLVCASAFTPAAEVHLLLHAPSVGACFGLARCQALTACFNMAMRISGRTSAECLSSP